MMRKYIPELIGALCGAAGGTAYYNYVGCTGGTCLITSSPYVSALFGAAMGALLISLFRK